MARGEYGRTADGLDGGHHLVGQPVALDRDFLVSLQRRPVPAEVEREAVERCEQVRDDGRPHSGVEAVAVGQEQGWPVAPQIVQGGVLAVIVSQLADAHIAATLPSRVRRLVPARRGSPPALADRNVYGCGQRRHPLEDRLPKRSDSQGSRRRVGAGAVIGGAPVRGRCYVRRRIGGRDACGRGRAAWSDRRRAVSTGHRTERLSRGSGTRDDRGHDADLLVDGEECPARTRRNRRRRWPPRRRRIDPRSRVGRARDQQYFEAQLMFQKRELLVHLSINQWFFSCKGQMILVIYF